MNSARWLKHPHNCRYVVCTWACWAVKKKKPRGCYVFWSAPPSPCVVLEPAVFSGEHWSSIMTFVGKSSLSPQWTALSCAILVIRFTQHRSGMCTAWWSNPFSVAREIIFFFFFFVTESGQKPHYTEMIYKQINFVCSRMVSQNYSSSTEETGTKLVCVANITPN